MVAQEILDLKDIDIEYNIKLILIILIICYSIAMIWWSNKMTEEYLFKQIMKYSMKVPAYTTLVLAPLLLIFLFREVSVFDMLNVLWLAYGIIETVIIFIILTGIFTPVLALFGFKGKENPRLKTRYLDDG